MAPGEFNLPHLERDYAAAKALLSDLGLTRR